MGERSRQSRKPEVLEAEGGCVEAERKAGRLAGWGSRRAALERATVTRRRGDACRSKEKKGRKRLSEGGIGEKIIKESRESLRRGLRTIKRVGPKSIRSTLTREKGGREIWAQTATKKMYAERSHEKPRCDYKIAGRQARRKCEVLCGKNMLTVARARQGSASGRIRTKTNIDLGLEGSTAELESTERT